MKKSISVIIPFYNSVFPLGRMLDSILASTLMPQEIILVNDGSTDASGDLAKEYAAKSGSIKYIEKEHAGVSAARNLGLEKATGDYIIFFDADDYIEPNMFELLFNAAQKKQDGSDLAGAICGYYTHKDDVITPYSPDFQESFVDSEVLIRAMFTNDNVRGFLFTRLFRADLLKNTESIRFDENISMCEDLLFQTKLFSKKNVTFAVVNSPLYHYIQSSSSATGAKAFFGDGRFVYEPAFELIRKELKGSADFVDESYQTILDNCMYSLLKAYNNGDKAAKNQIRQLQTLLRKIPIKKIDLHSLAYRYAPLLYSLKIK